MRTHPSQVPRQRIHGGVGLSTTSLPTRMQKSSDNCEVSTDDENDSIKSGRPSKHAKGVGSRRSLPSTPPHHLQIGSNKFRFRNGLSNGTRRLR